MNLLLDTDVLLDVALDRNPFAESATKLLNLLQFRPGSAFVAWHSISNFYYMTRPTSGDADVREFIRDLCGFVHVAEVGSSDMNYALELGLTDFEDSMQVAAAVACRARYIVTRNVRHYRRSPVTAISPGEAIKRLSLG